MAKIYRTATDKALQQERNRARRKVARYRDKGVQLDLPAFGDVRTMAGASKLAEQRRIREFLNTDHGVPLKRGTAPTADWQRHQRAINKVNRQSKAKIDKYAGVKLRGYGSVGDFMDMTVGSHYNKRLSPNIVGGSPSPNAPRRRKSTGYSSRAGLLRQTESFEEMVTSDYRERAAERQRENAIDMLNKSGEGHLGAVVELMTTEQVDVLMNMTPFMHNLKMRYESFKGKSSGSMGDVASTKAAMLVGDVLKEIK